MGSVTDASAVDAWWKNAVVYCVDPKTWLDMVRAAHAAGVRVLLDLPLNHVSVEHPWFQSARADRNSPYRDFFVWRDEPPPNPPAVVFPGEQETTWTRDEAAGQYYLHRYYHFMPDLNTRNPAVREEMYHVLGYWLALGVDGFRVDSVPFLVEEIGTAAGEQALDGERRRLPIGPYGYRWLRLAQDGIGAT